MPGIEIIIIGCLVASAAAIPGTFLILRKMAMMSDAISHSVLLGIVVMFFAVKTLHSPLLIVGATICGLLTVTLTELLIASKQLKKDAAIGLVFPLFFAVAIILISKFAGNIHLDQDAVLLGEIAFAPFNRLYISGLDLGPVSMWIMGSVLLFNMGLGKLCYKELKLCTFDPSLARSLGFTPWLIHYGLMTSVSITAVTAFDAVGTILIVALMITPPATAYLLTQRLSRMILYSIGIGCSSAILGYFLAIIVDGSIAGAICSVTGLWFIGAMLFSNSHGLLHKFYTKKRQKIQFSARLLTIQFYHHKGTQTEPFEYSLTNLIEHMQWNEHFARKVLGFAIEQQFITYTNGQYQLTDHGLEEAKTAMMIT